MSSREISPSQRGELRCVTIHNKRRGINEPGLAKKKCIKKKEISTTQFCDQHLFTFEIFVSRCLFMKKNSEIFWSAKSNEKTNKKFIALFFICFFFSIQVSKLLFLTKIVYQCGKVRENVELLSIVAQKLGL